MRILLVGNMRVYEFAALQRQSSVCRCAQLVDTESESSSSYTEFAPLFGKRISLVARKP